MIVFNRRITPRNTIVRRLLVKLFGLRFFYWEDRGRRWFMDFVRTRWLGYTPMDVVVKQLRLRERWPGEVVALDLFGRNGLWFTVDYAALCSYLEFYEINPAHARWAHRTMPSSIATIRNMDSIRCVQQGELLRDDYNLVVVDNPTGEYGENYCEHFDLFPHLFDHLADRAVIVLNVVCDLSSFTKRNDEEITDSQLTRRRAFYEMEPDADPCRLQIDDVLALYRKKVPANRFRVADVFFVPTHGEVVLLVLCVEKRV